MEIRRSTRHSKITGDFAESLVLYWLSKYGFECAMVDHTGIDIIARNGHNGELVGVSVKSRCRIASRESASVSIPADNFVKARNACKAFGCIPYFAIVVDRGDTICGFILPMARLLELCPPTSLGSYWRVSAKFLERCGAHDDVMAFQLVTKTAKWWQPSTNAPCEPPQ